MKIFVLIQLYGTEKIFSFFALDTTIHRCYQYRRQCLGRHARTPKSRDSISPSKMSCSALRDKLPGLPVTIEGDMLSKKNNRRVYVNREIVTVV